MRWDVIVVGSRVAGATTALLLARRGARVLAVDRARFPSDTLSTHQVQLPGVALLSRWGLLDGLVSAGTPGVRRIRLDVDGVVLDGSFAQHDGVDRLYSPRRTLLDAHLVDAARAAGAHVRDNFVVEDLVQADGRVGGVTGFTRGQHRATEFADLVVGADGKHSLVAGRVDAVRSHVRAPATVATYSYWSDVHTDGGELYLRPGRAVAALPTNDGLTVVYAAAPIDELPAVRADVETHHLRTLDRCGDLGERVRDGTRVERMRATPDLPQQVRSPTGPGWALVGDAGLVLDPVTAQGISHALGDAGRLADAIVTDALDTHRQRRDAAMMPMYWLTARLAALTPPNPSERLALQAVRDDPVATSQVLGMFAGTAPATWPRLARGTTAALWRRFFILQASRDLPDR